MPDDPEVGPVDVDTLERIGRRLEASARFETVEYQPEYDPNAVVAAYDLRYFPAAVDQAALHVRWFETEDFSIHYTEQYEDGTQWECRWDRHPNGHNTRMHFHPPTTAETPGEDAEYPDDWRDVISELLGDLDERIESFWDT